MSKGKYWGPREAVVLMAEKVMKERDEEPESEQRVDEEERHILDLLNEGLSNKEIGQRLERAEATIKAKFNRLYKKFGVATRIQLLTAAMREGLIRPEGRGPERKELP